MLHLNFHVVDIIVLGVLMIVGFLIPSIFRVISLFLRSKTKIAAKNQEETIKRIYWLIVIFGGIFFVVRLQPIVGSIVVLLSIGLSWFYLVNFVTGIIIRLNQIPLNGQAFFINSKQFELAEYGLFHVELKSANKEYYKFPNTKFRNKTIMLSTNISGAVQFAFNFTINASNEVETIKSINEKVLNHPWILSKPKHSIEVLKRDEHEVVLEIIIFGDELELLKKIPSILVEGNN
jgi:hypothetical protein